MSQPGFTAMADKVGTEFLLRDGDRFQGLVERLRDGAYELEVRWFVESHTAQQRKYLHVVLPDLADHLGYESLADLKHDLMGECWGWTTTKGGHEVPLRAHTEEMNEQEYARFLDWLVVWAAQLPGGGYRIPPPIKREPLAQAG